METASRTFLVNWAKQLHKQLAERIKIGEPIQSEKTKVLITDLKWRQSVLNTIITATANWDESQLAAMASRLCVRMSVEFLDQTTYDLAAKYDLGRRDIILSRIGEVDISTPAKVEAKKQLYALIKEAATYAFDGHERAYKAWFAKVA